MRVHELPVPLIYLDEQRSFGGPLDDGTTRMRYYRQVLERSLEAVRKTSDLPVGSWCGEGAG